MLPWDGGSEWFTLGAIFLCAVVFAGFGLVYGAGIGFAERLAAAGRLDGATFAWLFILVLSAAIAFPVWGYRRRSFRLHGHSGCRPVAREES